MRFPGRLVFHYATGGFAHFLRLMENSLQWAGRWGFRVAVITEPAKTLAFMPFEGLFRVYQPVPLVALSEIPSELLIRPTGVRVTDYHDHWGGGPCVLRADGVSEKPTSVTFLNRLALSPQLTIGDQKRFFHEPYQFLLPRLGLADDLAKRVDEVVSEVECRGTVGVHFRNTDSPGNLDDTFGRLDSFLSQNKLSRVLWCSDDAESLAIARSRFRHVDIEEGSTKPPIRPGWGSLHGGVDDEDVMWMLISTLADIALLSRTDYFLPAPNSAWAQLVPYFRQNPTVRDSFFSGVQN